MKQCSKCLRWKQLNEFGPRKHSTDGLNGQCKKCISAKNKQWKTDHPFEYLCSNMLAQAKKRARKREREFDLDYEYIKSIAVSHCPVLGTPLLWEYCHGKGTGDHSPSLDRIDNTKGYIKGNVAIISHRANAMKNYFLADELRSCLRYMEKRKSFDGRKLPGNIQPKAIKLVRVKSKHKPWRRATEDDRLKILQLHQKGMTCRTIAKHVDLSKSTIASIIKKYKECYTDGTFTP